MTTSARRPPALAATERAVSGLRAAIERGDLQAGDQLPSERELARQFGVSRPSIRTGMKALAAVGVLQIRHGAGTFIAAGPPVLASEPLSLLAALHGFTRAQLFEARIVLEVSVAGLAVERATPSNLAAIGNEVTAMFASFGDPDAFLLHDIRFHRAIAAAAHNPVLVSMVEMVSSLFQRVRHTTIRRARDLQEAAEEHRAIEQSIRAGDSERARQAMSAHLRRAERTQDAERKVATGASPATFPRRRRSGASAPASTVRIRRTDRTRTS